LLELPDLDPAQQKQFLEIVVRNARTMRHSVENLIALSRTENDSRQHRHVQLPEAAGEAIREVRESARDAGLEIRLGELPTIEINAAAVELCLANYLSNAIKYADPAKPNRFAEISGAVETGPKGERELVVRVRDNGHGVPPEMRDRLFQRFFRAHNVTSDIEGTGLGLSIVANTAESLGGRAWAEFPGDETVFAFSLPFRRAGTDVVPDAERDVGDDNAGKQAIG
nr:HAMP domain-containing histidine kinase [Gemmatimonadota bacterium]